MKNSTHKRGNGRTHIIVTAVLVVLIGTGIMLYPKMTDLRYWWAQSGFAAQAADAELAEAETALGTGLPAMGAVPERGDGILLPDGAVALLEIPAIDLKAYVVEGTEKSALAKGPGHYQGTPLPGEAGNCVIAGHRTMHGHPFHNIDLLEAGDEILTGTAGCTAVYRVVDIVIVSPSDLSIVAQTAADRLTLIACHPKGSAAQRLVVMAKRTG